MTNHQYFATGFLNITLVFALCSPCFSENVNTSPGFQEMRTGKRATFDTKGHPKAGDIGIKVSYPRSWIASEGERPHIVQKFSRKDGAAMALIIIIPFPHNRKISQNELSAAISKEGIKDSLPKGATIIGTTSTEIEGHKAGIIEYMLLGERAGHTVTLRSLVMMFFYKNAAIQIHASVRSPEPSTEAVGAAMKQYKPLFYEIFNSIVVDEIWTAPVQESSSAAVTFRDVFETSQLGLVIMFIVTWSLGLTPFLVIRFLITRRPLSSKVANVICGSICVFFWMAFRMLNTSMGQDSGYGAVWIAVFLVGRWILLRENEASKPTEAV